MNHKSKSEEAAFRITTIWLKTHREATVQPWIILIISSVAIVVLLFVAVASWYSKRFVLAILGVILALVAMPQVRMAVKRLVQVFAIGEGQLYGFLGVVNIKEEHDEEAAKDGVTTTIDSICNALSQNIKYLLPIKLREGPSYEDGTMDIVLEFETDNAGVRMLTSPMAGGTWSS